MKRNFDKFLSKTIITYTFLLVIIFILKLVGFDYFGLDVNNPIILKISEFCIKFKLDYLYSYVNCYITIYIMMSFTLNENSKRLKKFMFLLLPITIFVKYLTANPNNFIYVILQMLYLYIVIIIYKKEITFKYLKRYIGINALFLILQLISTICRNQDFNYSEYNFVIAFLLNFDYLIMIILIHKLYFMKGGKLCYQEAEVGFYLPKKKHLLNLLTKLQKNLHNFRKLPKVEKITIIIYLFFSLIWNVFTIIFVLTIAKLNDTFIECIFILTSFWVSKTTFGKPFHFSSMSKCFVVSNLTYYALNRITTPLGISIIIPIILGVGLSYVTSKFVKENIVKLYKGMPINEFNDMILKVTDKDSLQYKICHMFYVERKSELEIAHNVGYSIDNIKKIKAKINKKIKELN